MLQLFSLTVCGKRFTWNIHQYSKWYSIENQLHNCLSCFWYYATVLVALLVNYAKGRSPQKAIYGREIIHHAYSFVKSFCRDFSKSFSPHTAHNPKTRRTFVFHRMGQKAGQFKLPPFCFFAENDFESDFEIESENDFWFENWFWIWFWIWKCFAFGALARHVKHETESQKAHLWAENCTTAIQFCQELF